MIMFMTSKGNFIDRELAIAAFREWGMCDPQSDEELMNFVKEKL